MAHLGVWEKSRIHQALVQRAPGFAVPGFGTGWLPFMDASGGLDEPQDGVPGGVRNFNQQSGGTVTSVGLALPASTFSVTGSPVTGAGTLTGAFISQTQNTFLGAPNGSAGVPSFRALVAADIPALPYSPSALTNTHIFVGNGSNVATDVALSGDATLANTGALTLATVNSNVGTFTNSTITVNAKGLITAASTGAGSSQDERFNWLFT